MSMWFLQVLQVGSNSYGHVTCMTGHASSPVKKYRLYIFYDGPHTQLDRFQVWGVNITARALHVLDSHDFGDARAYPDATIGWDHASGVDMIRHPERSTRPPSKLFELKKEAWKRTGQK